MILYDPDPTQLLNQEQPNYIAIKLPSGGFVLVKPTGNYEMQIISVSSTDPQDYLNSRFQPGNILKMQSAFDSIKN